MNMEERLPPERDESKSIKAYLDVLCPASMPDEVKDELKSWAVVSKSPYSDSFYDITNKTWGPDPENHLRISDHWNFTSQGETHCRTNIDPPPSSWTLARHERGTYHIIKSWPMDLEREQAAQIKRGEDAFLRMFSPRKKLLVELLRQILEQPTMVTDVIGRNDSAKRAYLKALVKLGIVSDTDAKSAVTNDRFRGVPHLREYAEQHPAARRILYVKNEYVSFISAAIGIQENEKKENNKMEGKPLNITFIGTASCVNEDGYYGINDLDIHVFTVDGFDGTFTMQQGDLTGELDSGLGPKSILKLCELDNDKSLTDEEREERWGKWGAMENGVSYSEAMEALSSHTYAPSDERLLSLTSSFLLEASETDMEDAAITPEVRVVTKLKSTDSGAPGYTLAHPSASLGWINPHVFVFGVEHTKDVTPYDVIQLANKTAIWWGASEGKAADLILPIEELGEGKLLHVEKMWAANRGASGQSCENNQAMNPAKTQGHVRR